LVDDFPDDTEHAALISLAADGAGTQAGLIESTGDVDLFRFVAPVTGLLSVRMAAAPGSDLDSVLTLLDDQGNFLRSDDDGGGGPAGHDSRVFLAVSAGSTYYVRAEAFAALSTGAYV